MNRSCAAARHCSAAVPLPSAPLPTLLTALLLAVLSACSAPPRSRATAGAPAPPAGALQWTIDPQASHIWLQLHADGALARLGHPHVIVAQQLQGQLWLHPQVERSLVDLSIPVAALLVDDAAERARAGGEFAEPLDDAARAGTREHMLGERQLDAAHYPTIHLHSRQVRQVGPQTSIEFQVQLRDHQSVLTVPLQWQQGGGELRASGSVDFNQTDLGLEPYSALLGALRVADRINARFEIVAHRTP
jgi:polyisoprenoid-binding protein YceI